MVNEWDGYEDYTVVGERHRHGDTKSSDGLVVERSQASMDGDPIKDHALRVINTMLVDKAYDISLLLEAFKK